MSSKNNYNKIAFGYDRLSRLVFGSHQMRSQICLLRFISPGDKILIAGGGTGWILEEISRIYPSGLHIVYVEVSENMINLAKAKNAGDNKVEFLNMYIEQYRSAVSFDIIITAFLFDNFTEKTAAEVFYRLHALLNKNGKWLFADFQINAESNFRQKLLLKMMYWFFIFIASVETKRLINMESFFLSNGYKENFVAYHYNRFIRSSCWVKAV